MKKHNKQKQTKKQQTLSHIIIVVIQGAFQLKNTPHPPAPHTYIYICFIFVFS